MIIKNNLKETFIFLEKKEDKELLEKEILKYKFFPFQSIKIQFKENNFNNLDNIFKKHNIKLKNKFLKDKIFFIEI